MVELTRRGVLVGAGGVAAAAGVATVFGAGPAAATAPGLVGIFHDQGGQVFDVRSAADSGAFGAQGDGLVVRGTIAASTSALTSLDNPFQPSDVTKTITVQGAGPSNTTLVTTIAGYTSSGAVTLSTAAATSVTDAVTVFGTDDTTAINATITRAGQRGTVLLPGRIYLISGPISVPGSGGLLGDGCGPATSAIAGATVLVCTTASAGVVMTGSATYQGFAVHGNKIATAPLINGATSGGTATAANSNSTYINVRVAGAAGTGWTILGCQNSSYYHCSSVGNTSDGLVVDGGAGGLSFWNFTSRGNGNYAVSAPQGVTGNSDTYGTHTESVRFTGGTCGGPDDTGPAALNLTHATAWQLSDTNIGGPKFTGPAVLLDQSDGYGIDLRGCRISAATTGGGTTGYPCIKVSGTPPTVTTDVVFLVTDGIRFIAGDNSLSITGSGPHYYYSAMDWVCDDTVNKIQVTSGDQNFLLRGRPGSWITITPTSPWVAVAADPPAYRVDELRHVQLRGSVTGGTGTLATIFTLPTAYCPSVLGAGIATGADTTKRFAVATDSGGVSIVSVSTAGVVQGSTNLALDAIRFPID